MSELDEFVDQTQKQIIKQALSLYSETVVEHWLHPRNFRALETPDAQACIKGPCGDTMRIFLRVSQQKIAVASFLTDGCITTIASASMAVALAEGKAIEHARQISQEQILQHLGGLPEENQHCALLAANTLRAAIEALPDH